MQDKMKKKNIYNVYIKFTLMVCKYSLSLANDNKTSEHISCELLSQLH